MSTMGATAYTPRVGGRVADPMEMQKAMSPRNRPISLSGTTPRFQVRGTPRRERYSFLLGQGTRFLSADTLNDIASQSGRRMMTDATEDDEDAGEPQQDQTRRNKDTRGEFAFNRAWKPVVLDLSPASVKKSAKFYRTKQQQLDLRAVFERVDVKRDGKIDAEELTAQFRALDYEPEGGEAQDIIWEVDDDHDGVLTWSEFQAVYDRVRKDPYGREPRRLYNFIEFCLFDLDKSGLVGLNEVMEIFYRRYGKIPSIRNELKRSGKADDSSGTKITFTDFVKRDTTFFSVSRQIMKSKEEAAQYKTAQQAKEADSLSPRGDRSPRRIPLEPKPPKAKKQAGSPRKGQLGRLPPTCRTDALARKKKPKPKKKKTAPQSPIAEEWKLMTREQLREKARGEAESALLAETKEAKQRAMKGSDMAKPAAVVEDAEGSTPMRNENGELMVPYYPEIKAFIERQGNADIVPSKPLSWRVELEKLKKEKFELEKLKKEQMKEDFRPPSRIMYTHHGLTEPAKY